MRRLMTIAVAGLVACAAFGGEYEESYVDITGTTNAATAVTGTVTAVNGPIVQMHVVLGTATNVDVDITVDPADSNEDEFTLYSADDVTADTVLYPVFDRTDSAGAALTSDPPGPYVCTGDAVKCVVSDWAQASKTVRVKIVWEKD
jgi:hypothetical protein